MKTCGTVQMMRFSLGLQMKKRMKQMKATRNRTETHTLQSKEILVKVSFSTFGTPTLAGQGPLHKIHNNWFLAFLISETSKMDQRFFLFFSIIGPLNS